MELIKDDRGDAFQEWLLVEHPQQNPFRNDLDFRPRTGAGIEANLIADFLPQPRAAFIRHARRRRPRRDSPRLKDENLAPFRQTRIQKRWRRARRLPRTRRRTKHRAGTLAERCHDLRQDFVNRQRKERGHAGIVRVGRGFRGW